jgi:UPF0176 protein
MKYSVLLFYKYIKLTDLENLMKSQREVCETLNLKGRTIIAQEGINSTLGGLTDDIDKYIEYMKADERFEDIDFKLSKGNGPDDFPKLSVKVRSEIVATHLGDEDIDPIKVTGEYITVDELHNWFKTNKEFYLVDMRNTFEFKVGHFANSIDSTFDRFRDLPEILKKIEHLKDKVIVTACTGGVRCEKASGVLVRAGFKHVYQLHGGMHTYMAKFPGDDFLGKLYVFDGRVTMDFLEDESKRVVVGKCDVCESPSENYVNCANLACHKHFICCEDCIEKTGGLPFCGGECAKLFSKLSGV